MKKCALTLFTLAAMVGGTAAYTAEATETAATSALTLSADEQAFAAKLTDGNRKSFTDKLSTDQRRAVMVAVKNGAAPDEAVQRMIAAKEIKETPAVANAEKADAATLGK